LPSAQTKSTFLLGGLADDIGPLRGDRSTSPMLVSGAGGDSYRATASIPACTATDIFRWAII
jgi:hypothetical protein